MKLSARQFVAVVMSVCALLATVLLVRPATVGASTGSIVNITDPTIASRQAKVSSQGKLLTALCSGDECAGVHDGRLDVNARPLAPKTPWNQINDLQVSSATPRAVLFTSTGPTKLNLTSFTLAAEGPSAGTVHLFVIVYVSDTNAGNCVTLTGASFGAAERFVLTVPVGQTVNVTYPTPLVYSAFAAAGKRYCVDFEGTGPTSFVAHVSASGFLT